MRLVFVALAACSGEPAIQLLSDNNRPFEPAATSLSRTPPSACDASVPYTADDLFTLDLTGQPDNFYETTIGVRFHPDLPLAVSLHVALDPVRSFGGPSGQDGKLPLIDNTFVWVQGLDPNEIDAGELDNVVVRIDKLPAREGDTGTVTIRMAFVDGGIYDVQVSVPVRTTIPCPG